MCVAEGVAELTAPGTVVDSALRALAPAWESADATDVAAAVSTKSRESPENLESEFFFFRDDASKKSENGKSLENLKIENTRLLR